MIIEEYNEFNAKIAEVQQAANFIPDVTTDEGYQKSKRVALDVGKILTSLEKKRKEKKEFFLNGGKEVDRQAKEIARKLESFQLPHKDAYKQLDNEKKEREKARKMELEMRVSNMRELPNMMRESDSDSIKTALEHLMEEECLDFYEFTEQALKARNSAKSELSELYKNTLKAEAEAVELEKLRKEKEERDRKDREEAIRREASEKAEKEKQEAIDRELHAVKAAKDAEERRVEAEKNAKAYAEKAAKAAKDEEILRQQKEKERLEAEEKAREADEKHKSKINNEAVNALVALGVNESKAKEIVIAIHKKQIPNVTIKY